MSKKTSLNPVAAALGTTFAVSLAVSPLVKATENPFTMTELSNGGYMVAAAEGKCGEESGEDKGTEGKCGESSSGEDKDTEGKCGEGKCGEQG